MMIDGFYLALAEWLLEQPITADPKELAEQLQEFEDEYFRDQGATA